MGRVRNGSAARFSAVVVLVILALLGAREWMLEPLTVTSESMEPTVSAGGTVLVLKAGPLSNLVGEGSLVVFNSPAEGGLALKRIVAVGGQRVDIRDSVLYVDSVPRDEPWVDHESIDGTYFGPVTVPDGEIFVLGDNRSGSIDSRSYGSIPAADLVGAVLWPTGVMVRPEREQ